MENNKKNGKKTNKEKRVLIGALCVAAVMIAGSTFAWFTSQDEVTNRLSANADYNVSIVESFTPPKNWIPGQEINKDVYAINTGNVGAFVNQDVKGVLTYTVEQKVSEFSTGCVKLTADEVDVMKAGAYLAGAFGNNGTALTSATVGNIAEYFNNGAGTDPKTTDDFTPTEAGLYIFRRSIAVDPSTRSETFTYAGYYFDGTDYYKLADIKTNETPTGTAGENAINEDGNLTKCPTVLYAKEETKTVTPSLRYEPAVTGSGDADHPARLVASSMVGEAADTSNLNGADVDDKAKAADHALEDLNDAKAALDIAKAALDDASSGYQTALATITYYAGATNATNIAAADLSGLESIDTSTPSALVAEKVVANGVLKTKIDNYNSIVTATNALTAPTDDPTTLETTMNTKKSAMDNALSDFNNKKAAYEAAAGYAYTAPITNPAPEDALYVVWQADNAYRTAKAEYETAKAAYDSAKAAKDSYDSQKANYKAQLDALKGLIDSDVTSLKAAITERDNADPNKATDGTQSAYNTALATYNTALDAYNTALATYNAAAAAYQAALGNGNNFEIYINLSDDVVTSTTEKDKWQLMPIVAGAGGDTVAHFYYTGILNSAESSAKLIDSVKLSDNVTQDMYKNFDFDLNVILNSAQITYADDQKTITAEAVNDNADFENRTANLTDPTNIETPVLWS